MCLNVINFQWIDICFFVYLNHQLFLCLSRGVKHSHSFIAVNIDARVQNRRINAFRSRSSLKEKTSDCLSSNESVRLLIPNSWDAITWVQTNGLENMVRERLKIYMSSSNYCLITSAYYFSYIFTVFHLILSNSYLISSHSSLY